MSIKGWPPAARAPPFTAGVWVAMIRRTIHSHAPFAASFNLEPISRRSPAKLSICRDPGVSNPVAEDPTMHGSQFMPISTQPRHAGSARPRRSLHRKRRILAVVLERSSSIPRKVTQRVTTKNKKFYLRNEANCQCRFNRHWPAFPTPASRPTPPFPLSHSSRPATTSPFHTVGYPQQEPPRPCAS